jgi:hypothetical protein
MSRAYRNDTESPGVWFLALGAPDEPSIVDEYHALTSYWNLLRRPGVRGWMRISNFEQLLAAGCKGFGPTVASH